MPVKMYKVIVVGDGSVGKTSLISRKILNEFSQQYVPTVGVEIHPMLFDASEDKVCLNIWDCGGKPGNRGLEDGYYIDAHIAIVVFDSSSIDSFRNVRKWVESLRRVLSDNVPIIICGNKSEKGVERTSPLNIFYTSARTGAGVEQLFLSVLNLLKGT